MKHASGTMAVSIQNIFGRFYAAMPPGMRYGRVYRDTANLLKNSRNWSTEEIEAFQLAELKRLLEHCARNIPFYRESFRKAGLSVGDFSAIGAIAHLPLLDKDQVMANQNGMMAANIRKRDFIPVTTGGSSGVPLRFHQQKGRSWERELAFISALWERIGFRYGRDARLVLRGAIVGNPGGIKYKPASREFLCSTYDTDAKHLAGYLELLRKEKIRFIHGHVSSIAIFAQYVLSTGSALRLKGVLGGSEKVYPFQRELVEKAFGCRLFSWYGQSEQVVLAGECEHSDKYHVFPEYGLLELVDRRGNPISVPGEVGEIVGTGFNNFAMPLIRYRTGDLASFAEGRCAGCGRNYKVLEGIEGRNYEYVVTRSGNLVSLTGLIFGQHFEAFGCLSKMQVYQDTRGRIEIRIVPGRGYAAEKVHGELRRKIFAAVNSEVEIEIVVMENIEPSESGKHRFLIQKLDTIGNDARAVSAVGT